MSDVDSKPIEEDVRHDDLEFNPRLKPTEAKAWLNLLKESEKAFEDYNDHCDKIDKQYANIERLCNDVRPKEYQMFWSNAEVLKPSIYAKPPVPVVVPKFLDRRPVYQAAAEMLERCAVVAFDLAGIDELMKLLRDDLALIDRGVAWSRYQSGKGGDPEKVCFDFKNRKDFLHSISRNWREVTWVAGASYLTRAEARERFYEHSGEEYQDADYKVDKDAKEVGGADNRERAKFWEIWSLNDKRVIWVAEGCKMILDDDEPHLKLRNFFPCPKPAYGTVQRGSLVPVPDVLQYKDQLDEIDLLTGRIHALSDAIEAKGFYPAGGSELGDAIQAAINIKTPGRVLVPISNWAAFGGSKEVIIWLPIAEIAQTITDLVALRKEIIQDIYQIMGLSDIMRGSTNPQETLGAQQLKTQYGSTRIRDKQQEIVRIARDLVEITTEIITDKFSDVTIIEMSQTQLPTKEMVEQQIAKIVQGVKAQHDQIMQAASSPQGQMMAQQDPQAASQAQQAMAQIMDQAQKDIDRLQQQPTVEQVLRFLSDRKAKAFVLDIETDSTIVADEQAEKQQRTEFVGVLSQLVPQLAQMISAEPATADFCGEVLKFAVAPFRAGRSLDGAINNLVEQMKDKGQQPKGDDPVTAQNKTNLQIEQMKNETQKEKIKADAASDAAKLKQADDHKKMELENARLIEAAKLKANEQDDAARAQLQNQKAMESRENHQRDLIKSDLDVQAARQKADLAIQTHNLKADEMRQRQAERSAMQAFKMAQPVAPRNP